MEFASTQGGTCAYSKFLFRVPFVATINDSTKNLQHLDGHDWLRLPSNVVRVNLRGPMYEAPAASLS